MEGGGGGGSAPCSGAPKSLYHVAITSCREDHAYIKALRAYLTVYRTSAA